MLTVWLQYLPKRQNLKLLGNTKKKFINMHRFLDTWKNTITVWNFL